MLYDKDIREPLFDFLEESYGKSRIIEEKTMGKSRADIVMVVPDALYGVEIKSDADTYIRLDRQVKDYDRYFDFNIVVAGTSHGVHIREHVPDYWGIITVELIENTPDFYWLRHPDKNPKMVWKKKLSLLWRPELVQLQQWNKMPAYKEKSKRFVIEKIAQRLPVSIGENELSRQISQLLFVRDYTTINEMITQYRKNNY